MRAARWSGCTSAGPPRRRSRRGLWQAELGDRGWVVKREHVHAEADAAFRRHAELDAEGRRRPDGSWGKGHAARAADEETRVRGPAVVDAVRERLSLVAALRQGAPRASLGLSLEGEERGRACEQREQERGCRWSHGVFSSSGLADQALCLRRIHAMEPMRVSRPGAHVVGARFDGRVPRQWLDDAGITAVWSGGPWRLAGESLSQPPADR